MTSSPNPKPTPEHDWHLKYPKRYLLKLARQRAEKLGVPFKITEDHIDIPRVCPALGIPLMPHSKTNGPYSPTVDRLIPELGYIPSNVHVISSKANSAKSSLTLKETRLLLDWYNKAINDFHKEQQQDEL